MSRFCLALLALLLLGACEAPGDAPRGGAARSVPEAPPPAGGGGGY